MAVKLSQQIMLITIYLAYYVFSDKSKDECRNQKYDLLSHLSAEVLELQYIGINLLQVHWAQLLGDATSDCVLKVALIDDFGDLLDVKENIDEKEPFELVIDLCQNRSKSFIVAFYIKDQLYPVDSMEAKVRNKEFLESSKNLSICVPSKFSPKNIPELSNLGRLLLVGFYVLVSWIVLLTVACFIMNKL